MAERISDYFDIDRPSPYMLLVAQVAPGRCIEQPAGEKADMMARLNFKRSDIPAVTHLDYSARIQSVDSEHHSKYHDILKAFERRTGCAVLVNTSFNVRGRAHRLHPRGRLPVLHANGNGRLGAGKLYSEKGRTTPVEGKGELAR